MAVEEKPVDPKVAAAVREALERGDKFDRNKDELNLDKEVKKIPVDYDPAKDGSPPSGCDTKFPAGIAGGGAGVRITCRR